MTTNAQRGTAFERKVRADLVARGYTVVRSTVSHTPADLVALWQGLGPVTAIWGAPTDADPGQFAMMPVVLVQAKLDGRLYPTEWNALLRLSWSSGTDAVLAKPVREGRRVTVGYWRLTGQKVEGGRTMCPPMIRVYPPEVTDGA